MNSGSAIGMRVGVCGGRCWWCFGGVVAGVLGACGACGVCSRLLEMADVRVPPACRGNLTEGGTHELWTRR
jgi:hypothetical protein